MAKSKFSIDVEEEQADDRSDSASGRLGPMAAAIQETDATLRENAPARAAARETQTRYARLYKELVDSENAVELVALEDIDMTHITRDRSEEAPLALDELVKSISEVGLSNPIRVERREEGGYRLVQGAKRLAAYRRLRSETDGDAYDRIPASVWHETDVDLSYRRMVDENLIRENISFAELATLAIAFTADARSRARTTDEAVEELFASTNKAKKSNIRAFVRVMTVLGDHLHHPKDISRDFGLTIAQALRNPATAKRLIDALTDPGDRTARKEAGVIEKAIDDRLGGRKTQARRTPPRRLELSVDGVSLKVTVSSNRLIVDGLDLGEIGDDAIKRMVEAASRGKKG